MKKILIALDYNPTAEKIAETGYALAKATGAEVVLLHVVAEPNYYSTLDYSPIMGYSGFSSPEMLMMLDTTEIRKASQDFLEQSKKHLGDDGITTLVAEGDCADAILEAAKELGVDTIVMGTHSRRGLDKILMGSIAEKVLHHAEVPLFIIPTKQESK
ncbi:MAG: universal stress protein [Ferruginibacter sp.]